MARKHKSAILKSRRTNTLRCPYCQSKLDAVTSAGFDGDEAPELEAGCYSLCCYCLDLMLYDGRAYQRISAEKAAEVFQANEILAGLREELLWKLATSAASCGLAS